jgi:hypothetical protein
LNIKDLTGVTTRWVRADTFVVMAVNGRSSDLLLSKEIKGCAGIVLFVDL